MFMLMFHTDHYRLSGSPHCLINTDTWGFPGYSDGKECACNMGDPGLVTGLRRSPGEGHGNPLQYSCLENPMDRGAWRATAHGAAKSWTRLSNEHIQPQIVLGRTGKDTNKTGALPWEPQSNSTD